MRLHGFILFVVVLLWTPSVQAHQSSLSYSSIETANRGRDLQYEIRLSTKDLYEALQLGEDRDATDVEIEDGHERLMQYVFKRIRLRAGPECTFVAGGASVVTEGQRFAKISGTLSCPSPIRAATLEYELFFDLDPRHEGLLRVSGTLYQLTSDSKSHRFEFAGTGGEGGFGLGFIRSGWRHVIYGFDHILFLIALLLVVGIHEDNGTSKIQPLLKTLRHTTGIVTAFTVAHSLTLVVAALGWVTIPGRIVESLIALSILYVALENVVCSIPRFRYRITFAFGLVHGMGFAAMLRPILPPGESVGPLLWFNLGVELGQLTIVLISLPIVLLVLSRLGVSMYRKTIIPGTAVVLSTLALLWIAERALEIDVIGF